MSDPPTRLASLTRSLRPWQILERFILYDDTEVFVAYDGSGYTYQVKWVKEGDVWKITSMKYVIDGNGHLGLPPAHAAHDAFVTGMATYTGGAVHGRRAQEAMWGGAPAIAPVESVPRRLQSSPQYGNLDPRVSRLPTGLSSSNSVQMLWDRFAIQERISMYSWLADELRVNDPKGFVWGDMFADDASFCIYASGALVPPKFTDIVDGATLFGRGVGGGPGSPECSAALGVSCTSCTSNMGTYAQGSMAFMTRAQFGFNSVATAHHQQTRHTLTNWIFLEQTASTAITQMYNTLERFIDGIAYDGSFFMYQMHWTKVSGVWKWARIMAMNVGNGHLGGFPTFTDFSQFQAGIDGRRLGRQLGQVGNPPAVVGSALDLNPLVSRVPPVALASIADTSQSRWRPGAPTHARRGRSDHPTGMQGG